MALFMERDESKSFKTFFSFVECSSFFTFFFLYMIRLQYVHENSGKTKSCLVTERKKKINVCISV